jgi:predicted  nucleic acid-binding Zn-ribbon protein
MYTATIKGKINGLEETVKALTEELTFYKNEIANLRQEKNDLEQNLAKKTADIRNGLARDVMK